jgi:hypothetical protein
MRGAGIAFLWFGTASESPPALPQAELQKSQIKVVDVLP